MRHGKTIRKFGRETKQRDALLQGLAVGLIAHKKIKTTLAKAKELRPYIEKLITKSKTDTIATHRYLLTHLDEASIKRLRSTITSKIGTRPGGYTRIIRLPNRTSDGAAMGIIEVLD